MNSISYEQDKQYGTFCKVRYERRLRVFLQDSVREDMHGVG